MKKLCILGLLTIMVMSFTGIKNAYAQTDRDDKCCEDDSKYEYIYMNPPKKSLYAQGRYVVISSGVRYVHSPSKRKRAAHAERINAYNYEAGNY